MTKANLMTTLTILGFVLQLSCQATSSHTLAEGGQTDIPRDALLKFMQQVYQEFDQNKDVSRYLDQQGFDICVPNLAPIRSKFAYQCWVKLKVQGYEQSRHIVDQDTFRAEERKDGTYLLRYHQTWTAFEKFSSVEQRITNRWIKVSADAEVIVRPDSTEKPEKPKFTVKSLKIKNDKLIELPQPPPYAQK